MDLDIDLDKKNKIEDLQIRLRAIEGKASVLKEELDALEKEKSEILKEIRENSSERYEEQALELLYRQRRGK